ncbi:MraY family glycosyltransferase [Desulfosarcina ovata]|uniref:UDP-GlcNAc--UDP-phosphate GlcNAc-1-phosphate transferase n=1 Tax=Desulfosarcina ovata subsp. ovata TaxID=2752305 RepID=A0A5K8A562_9BACT|nr:glycosyltransferase family 4 protein [Desulfosarcina ovata]BBO87641.1 UDP-GlcNAc--UDP-phosphate GlcNAc-1-phosphate transferase [Desulfosarcina ovata subsp. ovata]
MILFLLLIYIFLGSLGAWLILRYAGTIDLLDHSNDRSSHKGVIPKGGGIGILAAIVISSISAKITPAFWGAATALSFISLLGDRKEISPKLRLTVQFISAIIFLVFSHQYTHTSYPIPAILFFVLFIVATTNWYNFMDGINGIAAITAIVGFSLLTYYNLDSHSNNKLTILSVSIIFSCLGFMPFNFPKAKVFMGDVGSILIGFVFSSFVVMLSDNFLDFVCLTGFLFPFYADEFVTMAIRLKDGENFFKAHRRHFYQLLANEMSIEHWKVSIGYGLLQLIVGLSILFTRPFGVSYVILILSCFLAVFIIANYIIRKKLGVRYEEIKAKSHKKIRN